MSDRALVEILGAISPEKFFADYWGKSLLHASGASERFEHLLSWGDLNLILETHRIVPPRIRLVQNGKSLDPDLYLSQGQESSRLKDGPFMARLQQGATLVLDAVEEIAPPIRDLAESFARTLKSNVTVNLYASWRRENGFDLHWDDQDVMIIQVSGRKRWQVYRPTRSSPLKDDVRPLRKPADDEMVLDQVLNPGDILYLPRGWWHVVTPLNEPSLHLTVTIVPPNGVDFLKWLRTEMLLNDHARANVPRLTAGGDLNNYFEQLRNSLAESITAENFQRFLRSWDANNRLPSRIRLPANSSESIPLSTEGAHIRLSSYRHLNLMKGDAPESISFTVDGRVWNGSTALSEVLNSLSGEQSQSFADLCKALPSEESVRDFKMLMMALVMEGVVIAEVKS